MENYTHIFHQDTALGQSTPNALFEGMVSAHPEMERIFRLIDRVAPTNSTVLILGESGTGKELIARAIHTASRVRGHFVPVNCAAIPDNLLESELFGYERGAFTGAVQAKQGRFSLANHGTIFLDEIGEMTPNLQAKLLRVIQERIVEPVGGLKPLPVNVRIVAATHANLHEKVKNGTFREDLFYRLQVVPIEVPPLRSRREDIFALIAHFSKKFSEVHRRKPLAMSNETLQTFLRYSWPGNIRELENLIERLSVLLDRDIVELADLPLHFLETAGPSLNFRPPALPQDGVDFNAAVEAFENTLIVQALQRTSGNKKAAARLLNLNRTTLVEKIKKKGLEPASTVLDSSLELQP